MTFLQTSDLSALDKNPPPHIDRHLWIHTVFISGGIFVLCSLLLLASRGNYTVYSTNKALAYTGLILIGLSLALSGICYFFNFADAFIVYRKHLGVVGFLYAAFHGIFSLFSFPERFPFPTYYANNFISFICAILALMILTIMAAISNTYVIHVLGGIRWRLMLRIGGYIAYIFILVHFWLRLSNRPHILGFTLFAGGVGVLLVRLFLALALFIKKRKVDSL